MFGLHLKNYKSFEDQQFDFSKINILIGTNSSGKSALLKFLLMLKQSLVSRGGKFEFKGEETDLGLFEDVVRNKSKNIEVQVTFNDWREDIAATLKDSSINSNNILFSIDNSLGGKGNSIEIKNDEIGYLEIYKVNSKPLKIVHFDKKEKIEIPENIFKVFNFGVFDSLQIDNKDGLIKKMLDFTARINENTVLEEKEEIILYKLSHVSFFNSSYIQFLELLINLCYYNPFNSKLQRTFEKENAQGLRSVKDLNTALQILTDESIDKEIRQMLFDKLESAVRDLGIADGILIEQGERIKVLELRVKTGKNGEYRNIVDVGFGVSLQIPLLLQAIISNEINNGQIILIEQPEIHIHPKLQAKLMEVLVKYGEKNTYIIETHSIHLIETLQVLVKQGVTKKEDVTIHYFTKENDTTKVSVHKIEEDGFLDISLPEDFMDVSYSQTFQLLD